MKTKAQEADSLHLKRYSKVIYRDTAVIVQKNITIPYDSSIVKVKNRWPVRFYYKYMFADPHETRVLNQPGNRVPYAGKVVGHIWIKKMEPFGTSINDTSNETKDWFIEAGNTIHILTKDRVILNTLLFEKNTILNHHTVEESERLLRKLPFILDARVYCIPRNSTADTVDIFIITKDVFSIGIYFKPLHINTLRIAVEEANMFGLGQRFFNAIILSTNRKVGYEGRYTVYNLYGTYITGELQAAFTEDSLLLGIRNEREFISQEIRNAGGLSYHYRILRYYSRYDDSRQRTDVADNNIDGWYGRSYPIATRPSSYPGSLSVVTAARVSGTWFTERPYTSIDTNLAFQQNTLLLGCVALSRSAFYKDILVRGFGVVEDIPNGLLVDATGGYSVGEFKSRPYGGIRIFHGTFGRPGYFFNSVELGSFFYDKHAEDGALRITSQYLSKLIGPRRLFKERVLVHTQYIRGINRTGTHDQLDFSEVTAVSGITTNLLFGNTALTGGVTLTVFSPWYFVGFRLGFFSLTQLTYFSGSNDFIFSSRNYWSFSNGIRLNNENFIIGTINFNVTVYPSPPPGMSAFYVGFTINPIFPLPDFNGKKPGIVTYGNPNKVYY